MAYQRKLALVDFSGKDELLLRRDLVVKHKILSVKEITTFESLTAALNARARQKEDSSENIVIFLNDDVNLESLEDIIAAYGVDGKNIMLACDKHNAKAFEPFFNLVEKHFGISKVLLTSQNNDEIYEKDTYRTMGTFMKDWLFPEQDIAPVTHNNTDDSTFPITRMKAHKTALDMETIINELFPRVQRISELAGVQSDEARLARKDGEGKTAFIRLLGQRTSTEPDKNDTDIISALIEEINARPSDATAADKAISMLQELLQAESVVSAEKAHTAGQPMVRSKV